MASTAFTRPHAALNSTSSRFGDYSMNGRATKDSVSSQFSNGGHTFTSNPWQTTSDIWGGGKPIGSGYAGARREIPRSQLTDTDLSNGPSGSSALAASSEADPWVGRTNGGWKRDSISPNHSGETSPTNLRVGSNSSATSALSDVNNTSPYMVSSRPKIGQVSSFNGAMPLKSSLDPSSGSFKYSYNSRSSSDNSENESSLLPRTPFEEQDGIQFDYRTRTYRSSISSGPRGSISSLGHEITPATSAYSKGPYSAFGNQQPNSFQAQRQILNGRQPSVASATSTRGFMSSAGQFQSTNSSYMGASYASKGQSAAIENDSLLDQASMSAYSSATYLGGAGLDGGHAANYTYGRSKPAQQTYGRETSQAPDSGFTTSRYQQRYADLDRSFQRLQLSQQATQQQDQFFGSQQVFSNQFQGQYPPTLWDYPYQTSRLPESYQPYQAPTLNYNLVPRGPARVHEFALGVRSVLLEEFRNNIKSNNRRYELKDIYGYVVEFSGDQHGSRFIQQKLETANSDEKDQIFVEIRQNALQLMTDVFGNYVIQKLFEHGNQIQKKMLAEIMKGRVNELSLQMYGCRVVQKALEHVLADQQAALVRELEVDILRCVKDQNGNHVVQKAIERCPKEHVQFILDAFRGQVHTLATHPYGCRVIQRMLEHCSEQDQASILEELFACAQMLIIDQYGNYVVQHVIQQGKPEHKAALIKLVTSQLHSLSKHKFASNVVERSFVCGTEEQKRAMVRLITEPSVDGSSPLHLMMKDQYGNYVIQKILIQLKGAEREAFIDQVKPHLAALRRNNAGKQLAAIEKLIFVAPLGPHRPPMAPSALTHAVHSITFGDIHPSSTPTPMLTMEQNSPQSSGMPSTTPSVADGLNEFGGVEGKTTNSTPTPEVRIEGVQV